SEQENIAATQDNRGDLQADNEIDDAIGGAKAPMRLPEPLREDPVFGDPVEHAIRPDNGGVHGSGKHQHADQNHERLKDQTYRVRADEVHGQPADEIPEICRAAGIRDDHYGKEGDPGGEDHAVGKDDESDFLEVWY